MRALLLVFLFPLVALATEPKWEKIEGCTLVQDGYRDGDSYLVRIAPRTFRIFRLYFVDTPEDSADQRYPERIKDQADYFGLSTEETVKLGDDAAAFANKALSKPFTVYTAWQKAPGASNRQRFYAMIEVGTGDDARWLTSLLVQEGLARVYGKRITLPCGTTSKEYRTLLEGLEEAAKREKKGGWSDLH